MDPSKDSLSSPARAMSFFQKYIIFSPNIISNPCFDSPLGIPHQIHQSYDSVCFPLALAIIHTLFPNLIYTT